MKKALSLILALVMCLSLCACGGGGESSKSNEVELTTTNIKNYLKISPKVEEVSFNEGGLGYIGAKGNADILIETINNSGAKFKDVSITFEVWVAGGLRCGWEFTRENNRCNEDHRQAYNYKEITINLSYNGEASSEEELKWVSYKNEDWAEGKMPVYDELSDSDIEIKIVKVSGTVIVDN